MFLKRRNEKMKKIIYNKLPMKYNVALEKFEPDIPTIKKPSAKNQVKISPIITFIIGLLLIWIVIIIYLMSRQ